LENIIFNRIENTAANSRFSQLRILLKPVADFKLENLILAVSKQFRSLQLTRSGGTLFANLTQNLQISNQNEITSIFFSEKNGNCFTSS